MRGFVSRYFDNSLTYDSPEAERLRAAAKRNKMFVALGLSERDGGSLYIAQWIIGPDGETIAKRRKLKPTHAERTVFGEGDGSHLAVHDLDVGRLGALCCWEHLQPLSKYAMYAQNEQVHIAAWPSFSLYDPFAHALGAEVNNAASKIYAVEGSCFVIAPCATVSQQMIDELCDTPEKHQFLHVGGGFAVIYGPDGAPLATAAAARQGGSSLRRHRSRHDLGRQGGGRSGRTLCAAGRHAASVQQSARQPGRDHGLAGRCRSPPPEAPPKPEPEGTQCIAVRARRKPPSEGAMESAIPPHLQVTRTRHRRVPDDYQPPYPAFVARHRPAVERVVMAYFGLQYAGEAPPARAAALAWIETMFAAQTVRSIGTARTIATRPGITTWSRSPIGMIRKHSRRGCRPRATAGPAKSKISPASVRSSKC